THLKTPGTVRVRTVLRRNEPVDRREDSPCYRRWWNSGRESEEPEPYRPTNTRRNIPRRTDEDSVVELAASRVPLRRGSPPLPQRDLLGRHHHTNATHRTIHYVHHKPARHGPRDNLPTSRQRLHLQLHQRPRHRDNRQ